MKAAKIFLLGMYVHFAASAAFPAAIFFVCAGSGWNALGLGLLAAYLLEVAAVQLAGWAAVVSAVRLGRRGELRKLREGWRLLKFASIPFFIANFFYSALIWTLLAAASRGIFGLLFPIPVFITCQMVVHSGCVGWCWLRRQRRGAQAAPGKLHYLWQVLPVADVIVTGVLLRRYREIPKRAGTPAETPGGTFPREPVGMEDPWDKG